MAVRWQGHALRLATTFPRSVQAQGTIAWVPWQRWWGLRVQNWLVVGAKQVNWLD